ncbi:MAG: hypothetical protein GF383_04960 [Candidatus Lokiarchaeota archaeon]|nr:hypothetical protein [Candidatus Lokiarchaeota archaeon]MBD3339219.1 hypothetical protein [Candidatus Lokiarchaeota archaeon]
MVYIMITSYYPLHVVKQVGEKYIEVRKKSGIKPSMAKRVVPVGVATTKDGFRITAVYEVKPGQYEETLKELTKTMLILAEVEGYTYVMETLLTGAEAMPMIGMSMPE